MAKDNEMKPVVESYNIGEEFLYSKSYLFIKGYATGLGLKYTLMALPLARKIHDGQYRFGCVQIDGKPHRLPYIVHCLKVCSTLISLSLPLSSEELDLLLASSILHDALENSKDFFRRAEENWYVSMAFQKRYLTPYSFSANRAAHQSMS